MSSVQTPMMQAEGARSLIFSDAAADKVRDLIEAEACEELKLRVFISGGGCAGFQYGFTLDESVEEDDWVIEKRGVQIVIDPMSGVYLRGAEIDYLDQGGQEQFVIRNPNVATTCGCGSACGG